MRRDPFARGNLRISGRCGLWLRESEHQPRLIGYPMRVQLRHLVEQFLVGRPCFLQPLEVLQVTHDAQFVALEVNVFCS